MAVVQQAVRSLRKVFENWQGYPVTPSIRRFQMGGVPALEVAYEYLKWDSRGWNFSAFMDRLRTHDPEVIRKLIKHPLDGQSLVLCGMAVEFKVPELFGEKKLFLSYYSTNLRLVLPVMEVRRQEESDQFANNFETLLSYGYPYFA